MRLSVCTRGYEIKRLENNNRTSWNIAQAFPKDSLLLGPVPWEKPLLSYPTNYPQFPTLVIQNTAGPGAPALQ